MKIEIDTRKMKKNSITIILNGVETKLFTGEEQQEILLHQIMLIFEEEKCLSYLVENLINKNKKKLLTKK
jgi:hypothetical protein